MPGLNVILSTLALRIRAKGAAAVGSFLPLQTEPVQIFDEFTEEACFRALGIEILISQDQDTLVLSGARVRPPERAGVAQMKATGGRRGEAAAVTLNRSPPGAGWPRISVASVLPTLPPWESRGNGEKMFADVRGLSRM